MMKPADKIPVACPHCSKQLGVEAVSKLMDESRFSFTMKPQEGEFLSAKSVGGIIENLGAMMDETGKAMGVKSHTVVESVAYEEGGTIKVNFLITRLERGEKLVRSDADAA
jgi:hypothetical protein